MKEEGSSTGTLKKTPKKGRLIIGQPLFSKILYLCHQINKVEWSGVLFFKVAEGDMYDPKGLVVEAIDLHLMDIDSAAATEFEYGEELIDVYEEHPEYMDLRMGSVHSHHTMAAFFSGTDDAELKKGSDSGDFYLMLIVNNTISGWVAKIGFSVEVKKTWKSLFTFKNKETIEKEGSSEKSEYINYELDIETPFHISEEIADPLDKRIKGIKDKKAEAAKKFSGYHYGYNPQGYRYGGYPQHQQKPEKVNGVVKYGEQKEIAGFRQKEDKDEEEQTIQLLTEEDLVDLILSRWMQPGEKIKAQAAVREMSRTFTAEKYLDGLEGRISTYLSGEDVTPDFLEMLFKKLKKPFLQVNSKWSKAVAKGIKEIEDDLDWFGAVETYLNDY